MTGDELIIYICQNKNKILLVHKNAQNKDNVMLKKFLPKKLSSFHNDALEMVPASNKKH